MPARPPTSQYATIDISLTNNITAFVATLPGDGLTLGPILDLVVAWGASPLRPQPSTLRGSITDSANGNVDLRSQRQPHGGPRGQPVETGTGTIKPGRGRQRRRHRGTTAWARFRSTPCRHLGAH